MACRWSLQESKYDQRGFNLLDFDHSLTLTHILVHVPAGQANTCRTLMFTHTHTHTCTSFFGIHMVFYSKMNLLSSQAQIAVQYAQIYDVDQQAASNVSGKKLLITL